MDRKTIIISIVIIAIGVLLGSLGLAWINRAAPSVGSAGYSNAALISTTSLATIVAGDVGMLFATSTDRCSARVITVNNASGASINNGIMLTFGEYSSSSIPTGIVGHWQTASTTEVYDGGLFGCGAWKAFSKQDVTLTVSEF